MISADDDFGVVGSSGDGGVGVRSYEHDNVVAHHLSDDNDVYLSDVVRHDK